MNKNKQPGTTWDMYGIKASESLNTTAGALGGRSAYRVSGGLYGDPSLDSTSTWKWSQMAPTADMLKQYGVLMIQSGDLNSLIIGPFDDRSDDDSGLIDNYLTTATAENHRGILCGGHGFVEDAVFNTGTPVIGLLSVDLVHESYIAFSLNNRYCIDLIPTSAITTNGDIYGIKNQCLYTLDVLTPTGDGQVAAYYEPDLGPYVSATFVDAEPAGNPNNHWQALTNGWDMFNMRSRLCDKSKGRLVYYYQVWSNVFGKICSVQGAPEFTTEVPNNDEGRTFVQFAGQNPLRQGNAIIKFALARDDRVTVKIYDVSGRLVRTLADNQWFKAGNYQERPLTWDGLDNSARQVARGVYFVSVKLQNSMIEQSRKMIVLK